MNVFQTDGPEESLITQPDNAIALLPLFETDEKFKHTVWIKKFTILLLQQFGDKHLFEVASLQVFILMTIHLNLENARNFGLFFARLYLLTPCCLL